MITDLLPPGALESLANRVALGRIREIQDVALPRLEPRTRGLWSHDRHSCRGGMLAWLDDADGADTAPHVSVARRGVVAR